MTELPGNRAEQAIARLKEMQAWGDVERAHHEADEVLCELLRDLNFGDVVEEWERVDRWYA